MSKGQGKSREITGVALQQYTNGGAEKEGQYLCQSLQHRQLQKQSGAGASPTVGGNY